MIIGYSRIDKKGVNMKRGDLLDYNRHPEWDKSCNDAVQYSGSAEVSVIQSIEQYGFLKQFF